MRRSNDRFFKTVEEELIASGHVESPIEDDMRARLMNNRNDRPQLLGRQIGEIKKVERKGTDNEFHGEGIA